MSEHLTPLDATFLELEQADDSAHMHIGAIMVFEPPAGTSPPTLRELTAHLEGRLGCLPRYSQRLATPHTGGMSWPEWTADPAFELARHVRRAAIPAPGGEPELAEWASGFFSQRLDRRRPLWEMVLVEGLEGGRWALATKTHHCMVDGVGSVDVGYLILDTAPRRRRGQPAPEVAADDGDGDGAGPGSALERIAHAWRGVLPTESLAAAAKMGAHGVLHPREALHSARAALDVIVRDELRAAPATSLNVPIGTLRRFEVVRVRLADMKEVKRALGGTVNDVALTVTAGGLRALMQARGERLPVAGVRAMVPMNVRTAEEHLALGNKVSSLFVELPVLEADTLRRYRETVAGSEALKHDGRQAEGTTAVMDISGLAPPLLHATLAQALYAKRLFNITITNVPGPQQTLYAFGSPLREIHPLVPLAAEHALGVALVSYDGDVFFGVVADPDVVPDLDVMLAGMRRALEELLQAAGSAAATVAPV
jgi:WS/DGAT/MGAT family acyltransferase